MGSKRKTSDDKPGKAKKKPHRIEPYWSTSKAFVAAINEQNVIHAVAEWLQAIDEQQKSLKLSSGLTSGEAGGSGEREKGHPEETEADNERSEVRNPTAGRSEQRDSHETTEKFVEVVTPYVDAFFRAGGSVSPLLACGRVDPSHLSTLFQALYHIILRGNALDAIDTSYVAGECVEFLRLNADNTHHMLSTVRSPRQNQLALEFLLAMTTVDTQVAIEVLAVADLKETNVRYMTQETTLGVRKAYINLVTGLLVCGDQSITRAIVFKPYLVTFIMENLVWDPADTVATFVTAIRCHLVQNRSILKAKKSEIFPGGVLTSLVRLYRWGGPANKPASLAHFSKRNKAKTARPPIEVDKAELEMVTASVHSLLLVLMTDHTLGLVYKDVSIGTKAQRNFLISHVFRCVEKPWYVPALGELFARTLTANPDVIKRVFQSMKPALEPRATNEWGKCIDFVEKVITDLHPENLIEASLGELSLSHLKSVVVDLCVPQILVGVLCGPDGGNFLGLYGRVTHRIARLMSRMLDNLNKVFERMVDWSEQGKLSESDASKVRHFVTDFLIRHFPPFLTMLKSCLGFMRAPDEMKSSDDNAPLVSGDATEHSSVLRFLLEYLKLSSKNDTSAATTGPESHKILMDMFATLHIESSAHPYLRYDFYELLLTLKEPSFSIDNDYMREHVRILFTDVLSRDGNVAAKAKNVLVALTRNAGLFEGITDIPAIWLDLCRKFLHVKDLDLLIESAVRAASNPSHYRSLIDRIDVLTVSKLCQTKNLQESLYYQADELNELFMRWERGGDAAAVEKGIFLSTIAYKLLNIPTWLPALLDVLKERRGQSTVRQLLRKQEFLRHLLTSLLFHYSQTATLIALVVQSARRDGTLPDDLVDYYESWTSKESPQALFLENHFTSKITGFLLVEDAHNFDDCDVLCSAVKTELFDEKDEISAREELVYLVRVVVFYIVELSRLRMLTSQIAKRCEQTLCVALSLAEKLHGEVSRQCLQIFLSNTNVIARFSPLGVLLSASAENVTSIVVAVLEKANTLCEARNAESLISVLKNPFKYKLLKALKCEIRKVGPVEIGGPTNVADLFEYSFDEITELLTDVVECRAARCWLELTDSSNGCRDTLSFWGLLAALLLQRAADSKGADKLPDDVVNELSQAVAELEEFASGPVERLEKAFLSYLQFRPQQLKCVSEELLPSFFKSSCLSPGGVNLAVWLCKRFSEKCLSILKEAMLQNSEVFQSHILLVMETMKGAFDQLEDGEKCVPYESCLALIAREVRSILANEVEPPKWISPYVDFIVALLAKHKRFSVAKSALFDLVQNPPLVTLDTYFYVELIGGLFRNACGLKAVPKLMLLYLSWVMNHLQKQEKSEEDIMFISKMCRVILKEMQSSKLKFSDLDKTKSDGKDGKDGKSGGKEGKSGGKEGKSGGKEGKSGGKEGKSGGKEGKSGGKEGPSGGKEGPSGGKEGPSGGKEGPSGGKEGPSGGKEGPSGGRGKESQDFVLRWDAVLDSETWMKFVPLALMFGLEPTNIQNESKHSEARSLVLRTLCRIIEVIYSYRPDNLQIATVFKLATQHSEFQICMTTDSPVRLELGAILKVLIEFSPSLMEGGHFPLLLTSYKATMEPADRVILQLLDKYESANIVPSKYKTFLWGQDGASVYATITEENSLQYDSNRVFSLLLRDGVLKTVLNFPLSRTLNVQESAYKETFCNESYDPAFYLPLLSTVTSPESPLKTFAFVRSGALALTLVSLSSDVEDVRRMAYSILSRFVDHLLTSKGMQVDVLNRFMDSLRIGVTSLMKGDENSSPQLSSVVAIFLAKTSLAICNPLAPMFTMLNSLLLSKVEMNLERVPEILSCMHSSTADSRDQRAWMLENLSSGLRTEMDFNLCFHNDVPVFRLLMDMSTSCVCDIHTKMAIVKVMTAAVAITEGATWLTFNGGLMSWLSNISEFGVFKNSIVVSPIVTCISNLWKSLIRGASLKLGPSQTFVEPVTSCQLLRLLLMFVPTVSSLETKTLSAFLSVVKEIFEAGHPESNWLLNHEVMKSIIEISSPALPSGTGTKCISILTFGCDFLVDEDDQEEALTVDEAAKHLESLTKTWVRLKSDSS